MKKWLGWLATALLILAVFALDYLVDLPSALGGSVLWECGANTAGFEWCGF